MTAPLSLKDSTTRLARVALRSFLDSGCTLDCAPSGPVRVSILLLVCNRAELTLVCLQTLALRLNQTPFEIVVVDNGSTDETAELLERIGGLRIIRNETNLGFPTGVNQAASVATGKYLLLLNNDTQVLGRSIDIAADFLDAHPDVGAVGGRIVLLDGSLQEAGCTMCQEGLPLQYARQAAAADPAADFQRDVDYCSAAFLMTPRELFARLGGLDEVFSPGYFEDPDYCIRLWQMGRRVVYLPDVALLHFESATAVTQVDQMGVFHRNHARFTPRHARWLRRRPTHAWPHLLARTADHFAFSVLLLGDAFVQDLPVEQALSVLEGLIARIHGLDGFVTLCLTGTVTRGLRPLIRHLPRTVEVLCLEEKDQLEPLVAGRVGWYDLIAAADPAALLPFQSAARGPDCALLRAGQFELLDVP